MLDARALMYAILVSLLIALVSAALVQLSYFMNLQQTDQFDRGRLIRNVKSGIALLRATEEEIELREVDLYQNGKDIVNISRQNWGLFSIGTSTAYIKKTTGIDTLSKTIILGDSESKFLEYGLYLTDQIRPLSLVGKTEIQGKVFLPEAGIKRGNIGGETFIGDKMIRGEKVKSETYLPSLDWGEIEKKANELWAVSEEGGVPYDNLNQSFEDETIIFFGKNITIRDLSLKGNIIIKASEKITVESSSQLEDVILVAPEVIIKNGFQGSFQAYAKDKIEISEYSYLEYPTVLFLSKNANRKDKTFIKVDSNVRLEGLILAYEKKYRKHPTHVSIGENSTIVGEVFVKGSVDLRGEVRGSLSCKEFQVKTSSSVYNNFLLDGKILRNELHDKFVSPLIDGTTDWAIVKYIQ